MYVLRGSRLRMTISPSAIIESIIMFLLARIDLPACLLRIRKPLVAFQKNTFF